MVLPTLILQGYLRYLRLRLVRVLRHGPLGRGHPIVVGWSMHIGLYLILPTRRLTRLRHISPSTISAPVLLHLRRIPRTRCTNFSPLLGLAVTIFLTRRIRPIAATTPLL